MVAVPLTLTPPSPFPAVIAEDRRAEEVAPGVARAEYDLRTKAGPLVIRVISVDLDNPTVHLRTALAEDRIISHAETVSSMARRTGAVAAINGDFFDIEQTNTPLNVLVQDGVVLRSPTYGRPALGVLADGRVVFGTPTMQGFVDGADGREPLAAVDIWPSDGYTLLRPLYGAPPPSNGIELPDGSTLAFPANLPPPSLPVSVTAQVTIDGEPVHQALGGGPLLLRDGQPYDDPTAPPNLTDKIRVPVAGAGTVPPSTLLLVEVDGHQPGYSVGLTRSEFTALFEGLGARDALSLDSGGSATIVARPLGEAEPVLLNHPSDGNERPVADALEVLNSAPSGPATRLVVRPGEIRTLPGAHTRFRVAAIDAGDHPASLPATLRVAAVPAGLGAVNGRVLFAAPTGPQRGLLAVASGGLRTEVPVDVLPRIERLQIDAPTTNPSTNARIPLKAVGFDDRGRPVSVDGVVRWSLTGTGNIDADGTYTAPARAGDAVVAATAGGGRATIALGTGNHDVALPWNPSWFTFASYPSGPGSVSTDDACGCLVLAYDFEEGERAAYARTRIAVNGRPVAFSVDVDGNDGGAWLRMRIDDARGRQYGLTLARNVNWSGWRRVRVAFPADAVTPLVIEDLYVVNSRGVTNGSLRFRAPMLTFPGAVTPMPVITR